MIIVENLINAKQNGIRKIGVGASYLGRRRLGVTFHFSGLARDNLGEVFEFVDERKNNNVY